MSDVLMKNLNDPSVIGIEEAPGDLEPLVKGKMPKHCDVEVMVQLAKGHSSKTRAWFERRGWQGDNDALRPIFVSETIPARDAKKLLKRMDSDIQCTVVNRKGEGTIYENYRTKLAGKMLWAWLQIFISQHQTQSQTVH